MGIIAGLLCFVFGSGLWWFHETVAVNDSFLNGVAGGAVVVMFAIGIGLIVASVRSRR